MFHKTGYLIVSENFEGSEIWHGIFLGLIFGPGIFLGLIFVPIRSSPSREIQSTPHGADTNLVSFFYCNYLLEQYLEFMHERH